VSFTSLPAILERRASVQSGERAYVFLDESGGEKATLTYGELHSRALAVAARLTRRCRPGDRAVLVFPQGLDFIVAYFGCLYAQVVAVPVSPPRGTRVQDTTRSIVRDSEPSAALTVRALLGTMRASLGVLGEWIAVDQVADAGFHRRPCPPDSIAFLQYTSGSTSSPKGVMVTHGNLSANQEMIKRAFGHDRRSTVVGWTPFFHDQGLIGNVLQPLYVGAAGILMSPMTFLRRPLLWLSTISRYRAHTSGGPNFAFDSCVARAARAGVPAATLDLSCWKVAFNGAEPIRPETLRDFASTFAAYGFSERALYPCYGLAEATLIVTGSVRGRGPRTVSADVDALSRGRFRPAPGRTLVGSGVAVVGADLRIVDPSTGRSCADGEVGEVWVSGEHVARGYWKKAAATAETFHATLSGERSYLRTGDLGVLVDEELYVVGRLKDLVIIRGRNHYPQDIENTVQSCHPAVTLAAGAAFSVPGSAGEKLVVVQEIRRDHLATADVAELAAAIREAVVREHEVSLGDLVLTRPGRLPKTSSGKIMRAAARTRYLEDGFDNWAPQAPERLVDRLEGSARGSVEP
jgi:acyl-CoA synthetase (AMP-forming)/AMP-acid ligase II